jgi:hypothetical protein
MIVFQPFIYHFSSGADSGSKILPEPAKCGDFLKNRLRLDLDRPERPRKYLCPQTQKTTGKMRRHDAVKGMWNERKQRKK